MQLTHLRPGTVAFCADTLPEVHRLALGLHAVGKFCRILAQFCDDDFIFELKVLYMYGMYISYRLFGHECLVTPSM